MFVQRQADQDIEFLPSDDVVEPELAGAEDEAVHLREREEPEDEAAEIAGETEASEDEVEDEHEEDVAEILRSHYGIVSAEPEEEPAWEPAGAAEFVCRSCFLRKPTSQLADPEQSICVDCRPR
jgi:hypothetical protein